MRLESRPTDFIERDLPPVIEPGHSYGSVTDKVNAVVLGRTPLGWLLGFGLAFVLIMLLLFAVTWLLIKGIGVWGVNIPIAWGYAITNFVWWIGIGHAGTLISAILLLLKQQVRTSINRFAEAMTIFAVAQAGVVYGVLALGWRGDARHWQRYEQAYYLLAALATPLVVSVRSVVSTDFAAAIVPGWHSTIFPPYFVA